MGRFGSAGGSGTRVGMLAGLALVLALTGMARAERVLVLAGGEPPCVRAAELAAALGRHGQLATVVRAVPDSNDAALVGVRATAAGLEVRLLRPSGLSERVIPTPPCEVAVEVVAAWVASVLDGTLVVAAPAPTPAPTAEPAVPAAPAVAAAPVDMRAAVLAELAWVGLDLEERGYQLGLSGAGGNWRVVLEQDGCIRRRAVGGVPPTQETAVTRLVAAVASMLGDPDSCANNELGQAQRKRLALAMREPLKEGGSTASLQGNLSITFGVLSWIGAAADDHLGDDNEHLLEVGGGMMIVGGAVGWGLDDRGFAQPVMDTLMWAGAGVSALGMTWEPEALAFLSQGIIELCEGVANPAVPRARLRAHARRMGATAAPSRAALVAAERDLHRSPSTTYRVVSAINFISAAAVAASMEFDQDLSQEERRERRSSAVTRGLLLGGIGGILLLKPSPWSEYQRRSGGIAGLLEVTPTAGGATLSARGRF